MLSVLEVTVDEGAGVSPVALEAKADVVAMADVANVPVQVDAVVMVVVSAPVLLQSPPSTLV
ncbi:hypothetical protein [Chitinophaga defluvii]|uniref:Uncharacterized protein n=1 Tax=Chitinophaga defluvii TaxID=3163343 RepID=A0ABV2T3P8_9BACT